MPELPDIEVYRQCLTERLVGSLLSRVHVRSPSLVRSFEPPVEAVEGKRLLEVRRLGKRLCLGLDEDYWLILHLMISGRLTWKQRPPLPAGKITSAILEFDAGLVVLTEASSKKRASLHTVRGAESLADHDPGGAEPLQINPSALGEVLRRGSHTLKRALTDPRLLAGIGNAYSDEILHAARLSPIRLTSRLTDEEVHRLHQAMQHVLRHWTKKLLAEFQDRFPGPGDITAFRPEFAVHGKYGKPCPVCGTAVQRIRYAENETNYCPRCQTDGKILADRSLSRLLREDWPRTIEELERS